MAAEVDVAEKSGSSGMGRIARLGALTSRVSGSYLGQRIKGAFQDPEARDKAMRRLHLDNAERVVQTMGALKGAAMKVGQSLALATDGLDLPPEVSRILGKLNDSAVAVPFPVIRAAIEKELDGTLEELFLDFDEEPLGTASLAQAHAARTKEGRAVVVKVLHHGIEGSVDSDLRALRSILVAGKVFRRPKEEIDDAFDEIRERLYEELDYYQEAANLEFFRANLNIPGIRIPGTVPSLSTGRVLTMDRLTGSSLDVFLETADDEARQCAGDLLVTAFHDMFYRLRTLHADPHGGNYLFNKDGTIGILDFGCVKRFDAFWTADYARMARGIVLDDPASCRAAARKIGVLTSDEEAAFDAMWQLGEGVCGPLRVDECCVAVGVDDTMEKVKAAVPGVLRRSDVVGPRHLVYLHRSLGGIYGMLQKLVHTYPYRALFLAHTAHAIAVAEGRVEDGSAVVGVPER